MFERFLKNGCGIQMSQATPTYNIPIYDIITGTINNDDSSASCVPEPEIKWDQCVNRDESLAGTPDSTIDNTDLIACSYNCYSDENCLNWLWNAQSRQCSLINAQMAESDRSRQ